MLKFVLHSLLAKQHTCICISRPLGPNAEILFLPKKNKKKNLIFFNGEVKIDISKNVLNNILMTILSF